MQPNLKTIAVKPEIYNKLKQMGDVGDSFSEVIAGLLRHVELHKREVKYTVRG